ncbi:MAG: DUF4317 domain-containing protein [Lachnospiraceae bacterium]|nr:DUF4317 domain-containing protein [Lachnospiraceae bacterium]
MIKSELAEIKKQFTPKKCSISRICTCYVDGEKNIKSTNTQAFLSLPEEEMFKYFEILRKPLSGTLDKNLVNLSFSLDSEQEGGTQEFLLRLRNSKLKDEELLNEFYQRIIDSYDYVGNYLIILIADAYDVPGKSTDGLTMDDASDEVYEYLLCCLCPVSLSQPGLSYDAMDNLFHNRIRDWVVELPKNGFLFPAFNDRSSDIHSAMYYSQDAKNLNEVLANDILGCSLPLTASEQKESFNEVIEETFEDTCSFRTIKNIHEKMNEIIDDHVDDPTPIRLDKTEVKNIFECCGVPEEKMEYFDTKYDNTLGKEPIAMSNIYNKTAFEVKSPDVVIKVNPQRTDLISTKEIDGRQCLVIKIDGGVTVNGIAVHPETEKEEE